MERIRPKRGPASKVDLVAVEAAERALLKMEAAEAAELAASLLTEAEKEASEAAKRQEQEEEKFELEGFVPVEFAIEADGDLIGLRLDVAVQSLLTKWSAGDEDGDVDAPEISRQTALALIAAGRVRIMSQGHVSRTLRAATRKGARLEGGQTVVLLLPPDDDDGSALLSDPVLSPPETGLGEIIPEDIPLAILFEDEEVLVVNKAPGMVVHPAPSGHNTGTLVHAAAFHLTRRSTHGPGEYYGDNADMDMDEPEGARPGIVHRLDKGTSGAIVVAKTRRSHARLCESFKMRKVSKTYLAVTVGDPGIGTIDKPVGRHPVHRQRMRVVPPTGRKGAAPGRRAISHVETLATDGKLSVVAVRIETGRTHQIRVHLLDRGTPIVGDDVYGVGVKNGRRGAGAERPLLHAARLELDHPVIVDAEGDAERMVFVAPMAPDMAAIVEGIWRGAREEMPEYFD